MSKIGTLPEKSGRLVPLIYGRVMYPHAPTLPVAFTSESQQKLPAKRLRNAIDAVLLLTLEPLLYRYDIFLLV